MVTFTGGHNGFRPTWFLEQAADFLEERLHKAGGTERPPQAPKDPSRPHAPSTTQGQSPADQNRAASRTYHEYAPGVPMPPPAPISPQSPNLQCGGSEAQARRQTAAASRPHDGAVAARAKQLISMGFSEEMAAKAAARSSTTEGSIEWIMQQSMQIVKDSSAALGRVEMRAPPTRAPAVDSEGDAKAQFGDRTSQAPGTSGAYGGTASAARPLTQAGASTSAARPLTQAPGASTSWLVAMAAPSAPSELSLMRSLRELGFSSQQATDASKRHSTVEGAVEWLLTNGGV